MMLTAVVFVVVMTQKRQKGSVVPWAIKFRLIVQVTMSLVVINQHASIIMFVMLVVFIAVWEFSQILKHFAGCLVIGWIVTSSQEKSKTGQKVAFLLLINHKCVKLVVVNGLLVANQISVNIQMLVVLNVVATTQANTTSPLSVLAPLVQLSVATALLTRLMPVAIV